MSSTRREFLAGAGALVGGLAISSLGIDLTSVIAYAEEMKKIEKVKTARQTTSICCYCSVGCGLICSTDKKTGKLSILKVILTIRSMKVHYVLRVLEFFRQLKPIHIV